MLRLARAQGIFYIILMGAPFAHAMESQPNLAQGRPRRCRSQSADSAKLTSQQQKDLAEAIQLNDLPFVRLYLSHATCLDFNYHGHGILYLALVASQNQNNLAIIKLLLKNNAPLDPQSALAKAILFRAIDYNSAWVIQNLKNRGFDLNVIARNETPLIYAVRNNKRRAVKALLAAGANINHGNGDTFPLVEAIHAGNSWMVELLLNYGAELMYVSPVAEFEDIDAFTMEFISRHENREDHNRIIRLLLLFSVPELDHFQPVFTPLFDRACEGHPVFLAVCHNQIDEVERLLEENKNKPLTENLEEAFALAVTQRKQSIIDIFLQYHISPQRTLHVLEVILKRLAYAISSDEMQRLKQSATTINELEDRRNDIERQLQAPILSRENQEKLQKELHNLDTFIQISRLICEYRVIIEELINHGPQIQAHISGSIMREGYRKIYIPLALYILLQTISLT